MSLWANHFLRNISVYMLSVIYFWEILRADRGQSRIKETASSVGLTDLHKLVIGVEITKTLENQLVNVLKMFFWMY